MWHEARKQERKIRGMMVDYKKRAERRREFYERTKADPTQFLQLHGRQCKIHLDPAVAQAADSPANMMPWQGNADTLIDRFDGRAHLDFIVEYKAKDNDEKSPSEETLEERQANYERYRILVENDFLGVSEEKFLTQIYLEEQFGPIGPKGEDEKKKSADKKVAIGYVYEDSTPQPHSFGNQSHSTSANDEEKDKDSDSDIDLDVTVDIEVLTADQKTEMNGQSFKYGMVANDFMSMMSRDKDEAETLRLAKEAEEEKAMYSGRKSRRERRAFREKKLQGRKISPPSYAARQSPTYNPYRRSKSTSRSRSKSPMDAGKITYITSFGGDASDDSGSEKNKWRSTFVGAGVVTSSESSMSLLSKETGNRKERNKSVVTSSRSRHSGNNRSSAKTRSRSRSRSRSRTRNSRSYRRSPRHRSYNRSRSRSPLYSRSRTSVRRGSSSSSRSSSFRKSSSSSSRSRSLDSSRSRRSSTRSSTRSGSRSRGAQRSSPRRPRSRSRTPRTSRRGSPQSSLGVGSNQSGGTASSTTQRIPRYYGRRRDQDRDSSRSDETSDSDEDDDRSKSIQQSTGSKTHSSAGKAVLGFKGQKLTPQERLKRKMQAALNRQYKADKKAEQRKMEKQEQERLDREEELRELAIRLRRRERERRHRRRDSDRERSEDRRRSRSWSGSRSSSRSSSSSSRSKSSHSRSPSTTPPASSGASRNVRRSRSPLVNY